MKTEEKDYLKLIHKNKNYKHRSFYGSLKNTINSQVKFKILNRELKKKDTLIRNLEIKIEKLNKRIGKLNKPLLNIKNNKQNKGKEVFLKDINKEEYKKNLPIINRISRHIEPNKYYTKTDIKKDFFVNYKKIDFCITHLLEKGIIKDKIINGAIKYIKNGN